ANQRISDCLSMTDLFINGSWFCLSQSNWTSGLISFARKTTVPAALVESTRTEDRLPTPTRFVCNGVKLTEFYFKS
ncbi:MAG: hypothetical protein KJS91_13985, partial [Planctomycetes bacterium]|nr:hypothetical protein [Planctomycetota bacterium]